MPTFELNNLSQAFPAHLQETDAGHAAYEAHLWGGGAVGALEEKLCRYYGVKHAVCVSNATTGLLIVALALDLKGDEFITSPYSYGATISGWLLAGNRPVFVDVERDTLGLNPAAVERAITKHTKAILATDIFGVPAATLSLRAVAEQYGLFYIADAAQSFGAYRAGLPAGSQAHALVLSFTVGKPLCAAEGGAILTDDDALYRKLIWHSQHPQRQERELGFRLTNEFALNGRIHPLAAAWANASFEISLELLRDKQRQCFALIELLNQSGLVEPITFAEQAILPSFFRLTATWKTAADDECLRAQLIEAGWNVTFTPPPVTLIYKQAAFLAQYPNQFCVPTPCAIAEAQAARRFCITAEQATTAQRDSAKLLLDH